MTLQLLAVVVAKLGIQGEGILTETDVVVARKSFDARTKKVRKAAATRCPAVVVSSVMFLAGQRGRRPTLAE